MHVYFFCEHKKYSFKNWAHLNLIGTVICHKATIFKKSFGFVLVYDFWTPPSPPPINFVHDHLFFSQIIIIFFIILGLG